MSPLCAWCAANAHRSAEQTAQPLEADLGDDLLGDGVFPQFGQRPLGHADQLLRRRGDLGDLLDEIGGELRRAATTVEVGPPFDPDKPPALKR